MKYHDKTFPNETDEYRRARNELLSFEIDLRSRIDRLGRMRMALPLGGALKEEYVFEAMDRSGRATKVTFSELFSRGRDSLVVYSFMYGPNQDSPCPACTSLLDGLNGCAPHILDRVNLAVAAKSPIQRIMDVATSRRWDNLPLLSSAGNGYNADYHAETDEGDQIPALNVFTKTGKGIHHFLNTELLYADLDGHPRHVDLIWPVWNLFDMTPEGRGADWFPKLSY